MVDRSVLQNWHYSPSVFEITAVIVWRCCEIRQQWLVVTVVARSTSACGRPWPAIHLVLESSSKIAYFKSYKITFKDFPSGKSTSEITIVVSLHREAFNSEERPLKDDMIVLRTCRLCFDALKAFVSFVERFNATFVLRIITTCLRCLVVTLKAWSH